MAPENFTAGPYEQSLKLPTAGEPHSLPLPLPSASSAAPSRKTTDVTDEQRVLVDRLIAHFNAPGFALPSTVKALKAVWKARDTAANGGTRSWFGGSSKKPVDNTTGASTPSSSASSATGTAPAADGTRGLDEREKCFWSYEQFHRTLRAVKWQYDQAVRRAEETCVWRREYGVEDLSAEHVAPEAETGKEVIFGYDNASRPCLYMHPYRQNTQVSPRQIEFNVWCLERVLDLCPPTVPPTEMLCLCIDFGAAGSGGSSQPTTLGQAKKVRISSALPTRPAERSRTSPAQVLHILQTYYYERLGKAVCVNVPSIFWAFYKLVGPFVDPATKEKIRFNANARELIPPEQLEKSCFNGELDFVYDNEQYFPALTKLCAERKQAALDRWRKFGNDQCGLSEVVIRGAILPESVEVARSINPYKLDVASAAATAAGGGGGGDDGTAAELETKMNGVTLNSAEADGQSAGLYRTISPAMSEGAQSFVDAPLASPRALDDARP